MSKTDQEIIFELNNQMFNQGKLFSECLKEYAQLKTSELEKENKELKRQLANYELKELKRK